MSWHLILKFCNIVYSVMIMTNLLQQVLKHNWIYVKIIVEHIIFNSISLLIEFTVFINSWQQSLDIFECFFKIMLQLSGFH